MSTRNDTTNLVAAQIALEEKAVSLGVEEYRKQAASHIEELPPGLRLIRESLGRVATRLQNDITAALTGQPGRSTGVYKYLCQFEIDLVAYVTAKTCINALGIRGPLTATALAISKALEDTINHENLKAEAPKLYKKLQDKIKKTDDARYRHIVLRKQQAYAMVDTVKWGQNEKTRLGTYLIEVMQEVTGLFTIEVQSTGKAGHLQYYLAPTETTLQWLEASNGQCELLNPVHMPMICPPAEWSTPFNGGYLTKPLRYNLVKTGNKNFLTELEATDLSMVYKSINALQNTGWAINKPILDVMQQVWNEGGKLGKLPSNRDVKAELPERPAGIDEDPKALKAWKVKAAKAYETHARARSKRVMVSQRLAMAHKFAEYESFYFAHALDWRGRAYAVSSLLNPQGDQATKALLVFSESKPLGPNGAYWLAVHGANCFGVDKVSFEDRVQWVSDNEELILDCAANPLDGSRFWLEADQPWMFLAFCKEWLAFYVHINTLANESETFMSNLPVSWDGSCNGLQNYSALLKDPIGGAATNLVPSDKPADIYKEVSTVAQREIDEEAAEGCPQAKRWVGRMNRKLSKTNTMTTPYSVSIFGMKQQMLEEFRKIIEAAEEEGRDVSDDYTFEDAAYIAAKNESAIGQVVVAAKVAMQWLKDVAKVAASNALPIYWTTPAGLKVLQNYRVIEGKRVDFQVAGKRVSLQLSVTGDKMDTRKMSAGIAANYIHSLDAAHMMRTVDYCLDNGVTSFAMIHDSFGTHAGDAEMLSIQLREAFIDQYKPNLLLDFVNQLAAQLPPELVEQLPPLPEMGTLDLELVRDSEYFFA